MSRTSTHWLLAALALVLVLTIGVAMASQRPTHEERDIIQERLNVPSAMLWEHTVAQTFTSHHDGLDAIELMLVRYRPDEALPPDARITLVLERLDVPAEPITTTLSCHTHDAGGKPRELAHNEIVRFSFAPIPDSAEGRYRLTLRTDADHGLAFWQTGSEAYSGGAALSDGVPQPGDLYLSTYYAYDVGHALADVVRIAGSHASRVPAILLVLFCPGAVALVWFAPRRTDTWETRAAVSLAASICFWAVAALWMSVIGWRITRLSIGIILTLLIGLGAYRVHRLGGLPRAEQQPLPMVALIAILLLSFGTRLLHTRELLVPNWVDSVHHTLIAQIIREQGRIPFSCEPYLPLEAFHYHFGFHANAAVFGLLGGLESHEAVLLLGQVLNALTPLTVAALATYLAQRRWAGVGAALVVATLSNMPAYYVSWGRYTQLTGLLVLPIACLVILWMWDRGRHESALPLLSALLIAGVGLTHYRVLVFLGAFGLCFPWISLWRQRGSSAIIRIGVATGIAGLVTILLVSPWIARFAQHVIPRIETLYEGLESTSRNDNTFPMDLVNSGWTRQLLYATGAGLRWARLRRQRRVLTVAVWAGLWLLAANPHVIGLPNTWLIQNPIVAISLWLPGSLVCGWLVGDAFCWLVAKLRRDTPMVPWKPIMATALTVALLTLGLWSAWHTIDIVNPVTTLVTEDDMRAIEWAAEHTPPDARFAINTRNWMGTIKTGSDGGWWLPILAHRSVHVPCVLYAQVSAAYRANVNAYAEDIESAESLDDPALIEHLREGGITHVFVGARGGVFMPTKLDDNPHFEMLYASGPSRIYAFRPQSTTGAE